MSVGMVQRYGEPKWETRPTETTLTTVCTNSLCSNLSYEELRLQYWNIIQPTVVAPLSVPPNLPFSPESSATLLAGPDPTITVIVGAPSDQSTWHIHRKLLVARSQFFKAALSGNFEEAKTSTVHLVEEEAGIFSFVVLWLYSTLNDRSGSLLPLELNRSDTLTLVKVYCVADKLKIDGLRNSVFTRLYMLHPFWRNLTPECVDYAWQRSVAGDPLIELLLDGVAYRVGWSLIKLKPTIPASAPDRAIASQWRDMFDCGGEIVVEVVDRIAARAATLALQPKDFYLKSLVMNSVWPDLSARSVS
ncbi:hypothetical protein MMC11_003640 [Xylographa trunciseda]|nr:hypothetical protein [Xylographa trunciseda]